MILHRDYETRSACDLRKCGVHRYAEDPTTDVIVAVFIVEDEDGKFSEPIIWYPGEPPPPYVYQAADEWIVAGHNSAFEQALDRGVLGPRYGFPIIPDEQVDCTLARCAIMGVPLALGQACAALKLRHRKDDAGHRLMMKMCKPKTHEPLTWHETPEQIKRLTEYCVADVYAEIGLGKALFPMSDNERLVWQLDQRMNNRGVQVDLDFVNVALGVVEQTIDRHNAEIRELTNGAVTKVTEVAKIKNWLQFDHGVELRIDAKIRRSGDEYEAEVIDKEAIEDLLEGLDEPLPAAARRVLEIRLAAGKSSVKKLQKFELQACSDGRTRGNLQYHGAQPGRWSGRGIQLQNVIRAGIKKEEGGYEEVAHALAELDVDLIELTYGNPIDLVSRMLRGLVIAAPGHKLIFGDYSNVEARACVWSARQKDQVELFANDGKIYETMGAAIFGLTVEEVIDGHKTGKNKLPRFIGKESVLGCGYGMGPAKFKAAVKKKSRIILPDEIAEKGVYGWREVNHRVVDYWRELENAARRAILKPGDVFQAGPFAYRRRGAWLQCRLPSGRIIWYCRPSIGPHVKDLADGKTEVRHDVIHYWTQNSVTKRWEKTITWGGKLLQNCIEGLCRDFLAGAKLKLDAMGYTIVLSVHDEAIAEVPEDFGSVKEFLSVMTELPSWGRGFPLKAEGNEGWRYAK
jgi:DNA polymerase bacteriophage-type